jgi:2-hydroxy-3-keto-5-methylthiopentenyl-1-phosphate phosphatase
MLNSKTIVLCDFDGTIIKDDGCDALMNQFAPKNWTDDGELYMAGKISHAEMNDRFVRNLKATRSEMDAVLKQEAVIREGFHDFHQYLQEKKIPLIVVSGGWDIYITSILDTLNFQFISKLDELNQYLEPTQTVVPLISNRVINHQTDRDWQVEQLWVDASCQLSCPCKAHFVDFLKNQGYQVITIGNSETDICMSEKADHVFATGSLKKHLQKKSIEYYPFETFSELTETVKKLDL